MNTLLLTQDRWDLCLDASGNIALATTPYAVAQDVASAIRLFVGELWYDTTKGVPYWTEILGKFPPLPLLRTRFVEAALTVPGVTSAVCYLATIRGRKLTGQIQVTFTPTADSASASGSQGGPARAVITFVGDNGGVLTFIGDNGGVVTFFGPA